MTFANGVLTTGISAGNAAAGAEAGAAGGIHPAVAVIVAAAKIAKEVGLSYLRKGAQADAASYEIPEFNLQKYMSTPRSIPDPSPMPKQRPIAGLDNPALPGRARHQTMTDSLQASQRQRRQEMQGMQNASPAKLSQAAGVGEPHTRSPQASDARVSQISNSPESTFGLRKVHDASRGYGQWVPDTTDLQANLLNARSPQHWHEIAREQQARHQQAALLNAEIDAQQAQARYYRFMQNVERNRLMLEARQAEEDSADNRVADPGTAPVSDAPNYLAEATRPLDESPALQQMIMRSNEARNHQAPSPQEIAESHSVEQGGIPSDRALRQLFHDWDIREASAHLPANKTKVAAGRKQFMEKLAQNMSVGPYAYKNGDGYVIIGEQAYGTNEALQVARKSVAYFAEHGKHLPALPYPTRPDLPKQVYPDVTEKIKLYQEQITKEIRSAIANTHMKSAPGNHGFSGAVTFFQENFGNGDRWDLQVEHNLPGQIAIKDIHGNYLYKKNTVDTTDQYGLYNGQIVRAGHLSNYFYGYAIAASGSFKGLAETGAFYANLKGGQSGDNPDDTAAIKEGYEAYWGKHPGIKRQWYQH